eukprot:2223692-Amphidinium_carterae.1
MAEDNSEFCRRPGVAVSEAASNFEATCRLLQTEFDTVSQLSCKHLLGALLGDPGSAKVGHCEDGGDAEDGKREVVR